MCGQGHRADSRLVLIVKALLKADCCLAPLLVKSRCGLVIAQARHAGSGSALRVRLGSDCAGERLARNRSRLLSLRISVGDIEVTVLRVGPKSRRIGSAQLENPQTENRKWTEHRWKEPNQKSTDQNSPPERSSKRPPTARLRKQAFQESFLFIFHLNRRPTGRQ